MPTPKTFHLRRGHYAATGRSSSSRSNVVTILPMMSAVTTTLLLLILLMISLVSGFCPQSTRGPLSRTASSSSSAPSSTFSLFKNASSSSSSTTTTDTLLYSMKDPKKKKKTVLSLSSTLKSKSSPSSHFASASAADFGASSSSSSSSASSSSSSSGIDDSSSEVVVNKKQRPSFPVILWRFTRPHTIIGSAMAIPALHFLAAPTLHAALSLRTGYAILYATLPALLMNLYITGLNQITDVDIDKINKPYLPMAAGLLSPRTAIAIVIVALTSSLYLGQASCFFGAGAGAALSTPGLQVALYGSAILGTLYSLPPFRFKRFPLLAAFCIVAVRGAIINAAFFAHAMQAAYYAYTTTTTATTAASINSKAVTVLYCLQNYPSCLYSSAFFAIFGLVIALMKDVPDVIGDRLANIFTFSVRIGPRRVFDMMKGLLTTLFWFVSATFATMAVNAATTSSVGLMACRGITSVASLIAGWSVQRQGRNVNPEDSGQVYKYYMHLWKLFYLSYVVLPFCR